MMCLNCNSTVISNIYLDAEFVTVCGLCGYGRPSLREPIQYDELYEKKYLSYPERDINEIRFLHVPYSGKHGALRLLDYGCGSGSFVRAARGRGFEAYGFDVNDFTADLRPPDRFAPDIVTAWDSFEHLTDEQQRAFFDRARAAKYVIVSVPDFGSADKADIAAWRHYRPREHLHYYTSVALIVRFEREGFRLFVVSHEEDRVRKAPWKNNILTAGFIGEIAHE